MTMKITIIILIKITCSHDQETFLFPEDLILISSLLSRILF